MSTVKVFWQNGSIDEIHDTSYGMGDYIHNPAIRISYGLDDLSEGLIAYTRSYEMQGEPSMAKDTEKGQPCFREAGGHFILVPPQLMDQVMEVKLDGVSVLRRSEETGKLLNLTRLNMLTRLYCKSGDDLAWYDTIVQIYNVLAPSFKRVAEEARLRCIAEKIGIDEEDLKAALAWNEQQNKKEVQVSQDTPDEEDDEEDYIDPAGYDDAYEEGFLNG